MVVSSNYVIFGEKNMLVKAWFGTLTTAIRRDCLLIKHHQDVLTLTLFARDAAH